MLVGSPLSEMQEPKKPPSKWQRLERQTPGSQMPESPVLERMTPQRALDERVNPKGLTPRGQHPKPRGWAGTWGTQWIGYEPIAKSASTTLSLFLTPLRGSSVFSKAKMVVSNSNPAASMTRNLNMEVKHGVVVPQPMSVELVGQDSFGIM